MSPVPPTSSMPPTPPPPPSWSTRPVPVPPLPSRCDLRNRAFTLHCQGHRPRAIGERLGVHRRTIADWLAADLARAARRHDHLNRDTRRRDVIAACEQISATAWDRYEHLSARAHRLLAYAFGEQAHDDGTPLTLAERRRALQIAERLRAGLSRCLRLAHHAQREVARLQYLEVLSKPKPDDGSRSSSRFSGAAWDDEQPLDFDVEDAEDDEDDPSNDDAPAAGVDPDAEDADDVDADLPDDDTDIRALEAFRDRLEAYAYQRRQQRQQRQQRAAAARANAAAARAAAERPVSSSHHTAPPRRRGPAAPTGATKSSGVAGTRSEEVGIGGEAFPPNIASSLSAPEHLAIPPDALSPHETGTAGETTSCKIENLAETATPPTPPLPPLPPAPPPSASVPWDIQSQDASSSPPLPGDVPSEES